MFIIELYHVLHSLYELTAVLPTHISDTNSCLVTLLDIAGLFLIALFSVFCVCCVQVYFIFTAYTTF